MQNVIVIGASGDQGAAQLVALEQAGFDVAGASRDPARHSFPGNVGKVQLDLLDGEHLQRALAPFDTVFLNLPSASFNPAEHILRGADNLIVAATAAGVERIVFNASLYVGDAPNGFVAHDTRFKIIERLIGGSVPATAVCPVIFIDNLLRDWALPSLRERGVLSYPHAETLPVSWVSLGDVASIMVALATSPDTANQKFVVGGPQALKGPETAAALSRGWDTPIDFESLPIPVFAERMGALFAGGNAGKAATIADELARIYSWYNEAAPSPFTVDMTPLVDRFGLELTTVEQWAAANPLRS
ncbi:NmrA-like family protein [Luminiphilus syltensis NOR5-1B]|uniref:NmrA-like family protein n=1 Tax=Luminiphilus syltensis NOR5-1B TaxID=565045 RepID=B8KRC5_9GAMM|nr:NmrA family NAD(P)-binding protein [Luminiphilus syltensis]EED35391.1 NmrA-like family protein [Luminiphilus syltensis NOR5-1B]